MPIYTDSKCPICGGNNIIEETCTRTVCGNCNKWYDVNVSRITFEPLHDRDPLLQERQKTHGNFATNAQASQEIKKLFQSYSYHQLIPIHREALDMIALKLSRILSGQANFKDHWDDIAGYAKLGSEACKDA